MEKKKEKDSSLYKDYKLFLSKDWFEVIEVNCDIDNILFFRIDIPLSSESIQFGTKITRMEPDNKVELRKILGQQNLPLNQHFSS